MKIETIYFLERINKGNYEHMELSATAKVEDGEDAVTAMLALKTLVNAALTNKVAEIQEAKAEIKKSQEAVVESPKIEEVKEEKPKQTRTRKPKEDVKVEEVVETPAVEEVKEEKPKKSKITPYGADNKAVLQAYLTKKYAEAWKTIKPKHEIIDFTSKLPGKPFLDEEGNIVQSFLDEIHGFFGQ